MDSLERYEFIVEQIKSNSSAGERIGIGRLESLLSIVGLGGGVDKNVGKILLELQQVRHVLVHRQGRVDRRLKANCPWIQRLVGDTLKVPPERSFQYLKAARLYLLELACRMGEKYGVNMNDVRDKLRASADVLE
jgi:hypothetical protein